MGTERDPSVRPTPKSRVSGYLHTSFRVLFLTERVGRLGLSSVEAEGDRTLLPEGP